MTTTITPAEKEIKYDRETKDFAMYLHGQLCGFARTFQEAEATLDALMYECLRHEAVTAADDAADRDATRYGVCDEPTIDESTGRTEPCGARFPIFADADAIVYCPVCGSSAIIEDSDLAFPNLLDVAILARREALLLDADADETPSGDRAAAEVVRQYSNSWR